MNKKPKLTAVIFYAVLLLVLIYAVSALFGNSSEETLTYSEVKTLFQEEQVKSFVTKDGELTMELRTPYEGKEKLTYELPSFAVFYSDLNDTIRSQYANGILESYDYQPDTKSSWFLTLLPYLLLLVVAGVVLFVVVNRANGSNIIGKFSKANTRSGLEPGKKVTFDDVAGAEEEKAELQEIVDFLRDPKKYARMGAKIPKGVLLVGPPGTGKTLIARAVAGEAHVEFLSISGSDFVELYVGVGASRVRDLFEQAKRVAPAIIFIDEIDAVGRRRGAGLGGGHDEREQTLNQLLVEMDGFTKNEDVIVMAATNRADILDPALLRPGRFDRQIYVGAPDVTGREAILKVHAKDKPLADNVDLKVVARATAGFTGADLENLLNESALLAARRNRPVITMPDVEESILKILAGPEKKSHVVSEYDRRLTAVHEAGHAVAMYRLPTHDPVHRISVIPRGMTGGMTISLPVEDSDHLSKNQMFEQLVALLGGRVAEQLCLSDISTGASNDLKQATKLAHDMVAKYGMSTRIGLVSYDNDSEIFVGRDYEKTKSYSERTAGTIDDEIKALMDAAYARCRELLTADREKLDAVTAYLIAHLTMTRRQFEACMEGREIPAEEENLFASFREQTPQEQAQEEDRPDSPANSTAAPASPDEPTNPPTARQA